MGIGSVLQQLLTAQNTNVNEVSVATGVHPQTLYSMIKRDSMKANIEDLHKVAHCLGVDLNYFYSSLHASIPFSGEMARIAAKNATATTRITEKLPRLTEEQLNALEKRVDTYIDDNEIAAKQTMAEPMKKAT